MNTTTCDVCGKEYGIGDSPFCRDGHTGGGRYGFDAFTPVDDDMVSRDGPVHFGNRGERLRYLDRNAIVPKDLSHKRPGRRIYLDMKG